MSSRGSEHTLLQKPDIRLDPGLLILLVDDRFNAASQVSQVRCSSHC